MSKCHKKAFLSACLMALMALGLSACETRMQKTTPANPINASEMEVPGEFQGVGGQEELENRDVDENEQDVSGMGDTEPVPEGVEREVQVGGTE